MTEKDKNVPELSYEKWILNLAFLTDITILLNELNMKLFFFCFGFGQSRPYL